MKKLPFPLLTVAFTAFAVAQAQMNLPSASDAPPEEVVQLSEFVVSSARDEGYRATNSTAGSRTNEKIRNLPLNIQAITLDFMRDIDARDLEEAVSYVGNVASDSVVHNGNSANIRGSNSQFQLRNFFRWYVVSNSYNTERVEVLKGPAAVLYTQAFPGGALNIVTKAPEKRNFQRISTRAGSYDAYSANLDVNQTLGPIQIRLNGIYSDADSYLDYANVRIKGISPSVAFQPFKNTRVVIEYEKTVYERCHQGGISQYFAAIPASGVRAGNVYGKVPLTKRYMGASSAADQDVTNVGVRVEQRITGDFSINAAYNYSLNERDIFRPYSINFAQIRIDAGGDFVQQRWQRVSNVNSFWSGQLSAVYKFKLLGLENKLLGGYDTGSDHYTNEVLSEFKANGTARNIKYYLADNPDLSYKPEDGAYFSRGNGDNSKNDFLGYFATLQSATRNGVFRSLLGIRYDEFTTKYLQGSPNYADALQPNKVTGNQTSPMMGVLITPWQPLSFYGLYSEAYTPNSNRRDAYNNILPAQSADGYEFGIKTSGFHGRISGSFSIYDTKIKNRTESDPNPPAGAINAGNAFIASGKDRLKGFDADFIITPLTGWDINLSYGYSDARVIKSTASNREGQRLTNHAFNSFAMFTRYTIQNGILKGAYAGAGVRYRDAGLRRYVGDAPDECDSLTSVNLLLGYVFRIGKKHQIRAALNINNVFDQEAVVSPNGVPNLAPPRMFAFTLTYSH